MNTTLDQTRIETLQTTATFDRDGILHGTEPLPQFEGETVHVLVIRVRESSAFDASQIDEKAWHRGIASNPAFAFLKDAAEDIYSWEDGTPLPPLRADTKSP